MSSGGLTVQFRGTGQEGLCLSSDLHHSKWKMICLLGLGIEHNPLSLQHSPVVWINPGLSLEFLNKTYILTAFLVPLTCRFVVLF